MAAPANASVGTEWTDDNGVVRVCRTVTPRVWVLKRAPRHFPQSADPPSDPVGGDMWTSGENRLHIFGDGIWRDTTCPRVPVTFTGTLPPSNPGVGDKWNDGVSLVEYTTDGTDFFWREA